MKNSFHINIALIAKINYKTDKINKKLKLNKNALTITEHFIELKNRFLYIIYFFIATSIISYCYSKEIYYFLLKPLLINYQNTGKQAKIIYTNLTEAFFTYITLSLWTATFFTLPLLLTQIYKFTAPALSKQSKNIVIIYMVLSVILFFLGAYIAYHFIFPSAWGFFLSFENQNINNTGASIMLEARVSEYLSLSLQIILAFGISFQSPVILMIFEKIGIISVKTLRSKRRIAIVIIFIIAAIITPPDVLSQIILATLMILLYELAIIGCTLQNKGKTKNA